MLLQKLKALAPGFLTAAATGLAAIFLGEHYSAPTMLFALLLGIALSFTYEETKSRAGIDWTSGTVLKFGVALLGLRITFQDFTALGWKTTLIICLAIATTIGLGIILSRIFRLGSDFGALTGGATAICGVSAAMAIAAILPHDKNHQRNTLLTVIGITTFSTFAMIAYPIIGGALGFTHEEMGIFLGGTIHDVAQVVGAGYSVSEDTGDIATLTKLVRVSMLIPVILILLFTLNKKSFDKSASKKKNLPKVPLFLIAFAGLVAINSLALVPEILKTNINHLARFCLVIAIAAIGMKSKLKELTSVGLKPIILMTAESLWLMSFILLSLIIL